MNITDFIFFIIFIGFPIVGIILSYYIKIRIQSTTIKSCFLFFLIHNILFFFGFSLKGDFIDYGIFSIEYFTLCLVIFTMPKAKTVYTKIFLLTGITVIFCGFIVGIIGVFMSNVLFQGFKADEIFHFESDKTNYETRRYSFGFVTLGDISYTFETYKNYSYLPIEKKIDKAKFFAARTNVDIGEQALQINIVESRGKNQLVFTSTNGQKFFKPLD